MKLKLDANGNAVLQDGKPVFIQDDGVEVAVDVPGMRASIARANADAKTNRERAEAAELRVKAYEGIDDPEAARKALNTVANLDAKKLVDAGHVETLKADLNKAWEAKLKEATEQRDTFQKQLVEEKIGGAFARSTFISEKLAVPGDMVRATFGSHFKIEGDKIVGYDKAGNRLNSRANPGEVADFEEGLSMLVEGYAHKDTILKSAHKSGGGAPPTGGGGGGANAVPRSVFNAKSPADQMAHMKSGGSVTD